MWGLNIQGRVSHYYDYDNNKLEEKTQIKVPHYSMYSFLVAITMVTQGSQKQSADGQAHGPAEGGAVINNSRAKCTSKFWT